MAPPVSDGSPGRVPEGTSISPEHRTFPSRAPRGWLVHAFVVLFLSVSAFHAVRQARSWAQPAPPLFGLAERLEREIPPEDAILILAPHEAREDPSVLILNTRLYPRRVFMLPKGARTLEDARDWAEGRQIGWVLSMDGPPFDPARARVRRLHDDH